MRRFYESDNLSLSSPSVSSERALSDNDSSIIPIDRGALPSYAVEKVCDRSPLCSWRSYMYCLLYTMILYSITGSAYAMGYSTPSSKYKKGLEYFNKEYYSTSKYYFDQYLDLCDENALLKVEAEYHSAMSSSILNHPIGKRNFDAFIRKHKNSNRVSYAFFQLGNSHFAEKEYISAIEYYEQIDDAYLGPSLKYKLQYRLAYSYLNEKDFDKSLEHFKLIIDESHKYTSAANYYAGYIFLRKEQYDEAIKSFNEAAKKEELKCIVPYLICKCYYQQKKYDEVISYVKKVFYESIDIKNREEMELMLAEAYFFKQDYHRAHRHYENFISYSDMKVESKVLFRNGYSLMKSGHQSRALKVFESLTPQQNSIGQRSYYYIGEIYSRHRKMPDHSLLAFANAHRDNYDLSIKEKSGFLLGKINSDLGNHVVAIDALKAFKKEFPNSVYIKDVNTLLGELYLNTNNFDLAISEIEKSGNKSPHMLSLYQKGTFYRANEYFTNSDYGMAIEYFKKSIETGSDEKIRYKAILWLGECYSALDQNKMAIDTYNRVLDNNKVRDRDLRKDSYYSRGYAYYNSGRYRLAISDFESFLARADSEDTTFTIDTLTKLGDSYFALNNWGKAQDYYLKAYDRDTSSTYPLLQRVKIFVIQNKYDKGKQEVDKILLHPEKGDHNIKLAKYFDAEISFGQMKFDEAIRKYDHFLESKETNEWTVEAMYNKGVSHLNIDQRAKAIGTFRSIVRSHPESIKAKDSLLELEKLISNKELESLLEIYKKSNPSKQSLIEIEYERIKSLYNKKDYTECIKKSTNYIHNYRDIPQSVEVIHTMALCLKQLGKPKDSIHQYTKVLESDSYKYYNKALLQLARLYYEIEDYSKSYHSYEELLRRSTTKKEKLLSKVGLMTNYWELRRYDDVARLAQEIDSMSTLPGYKFLARLYYARSLMSQDKKEEALDVLVSLVKESRGVHAAEGQYMIAKYYFSMNQYDKSLAEIFRMNQEFKEYIEWIDRGFVLMVENYLAKGDTFQAKATLSSILDNSKNPEMIKYAERKLSKLNKIKESDIQIVDKDEVSGEYKEDFYIIK